MKINIITIHSIPNFGSIFQTYALCEHLKKCGYTDTEVIDYRPGYYESKSLRSRIGKILNYKSYVVREKKFNEFRANHIPLTKDVFLNFEQLKNHGFDADVYIAGGDQLWNVYYPCGNDDAYKLTFVNGKKISYGTSTGQTGFTDEEIKNLAEKIKDFSSVSVRESGSVDMLEKGGINAVHCVDPVYLLDAEDYDKFIKPVNQPKYMIVYLVTPSELLERCIKYLSEKYNLKVILCSGFSKKCTCDEFLKDLGPDEILSYIKNAEIVLSSSFHATAFSMLFKKQFFTILPNQHTNERIEDILKIRGLYDRIITDESDVEEILSKEINYDNNDDYSKLISESKEYLRISLNE